MNNFPITMLAPAMAMSSIGILVIKFLIDVARGKYKN